VPPYALLWVASFFVRDVRFLLNIINNDYKVSTEKARTILKMEFTPVLPMMIQYLYQAIEFGRIPDVRKRKAKL
jgi:hypothetical protein